MITAMTLLMLQLSFCCRQDCGSQKPLQTAPISTQKFAFDGPNYKRWRPAASHVDWPISRTLLTVRPAWQDAVLLRRMTTTVLVTAYCRALQTPDILIKEWGNICARYILQNTVIIDTC